MEEEHRRYHAVANIFPLMDGPEFDALKADIAEHGLREPIWLHPDGSIIDGRNRHRACVELGIVPRFETWGGGTTKELIEFVVSANLHRRHLDAGQRAMIGLRVKDILSVEIAAEKKIKGREAARKRWYGPQAEDATNLLLGDSEGDAVNLRSEEPETQLYAVISGDGVKIGVSAYPLARIEELRVGNPSPLKMYRYCPATKKDERELHRALHRYAVSGEWFEWNAITKEIVDSFLDNLMGFYTGIKTHEVFEPPKDGDAFRDGRNATAEAAIAAGVSTATMSRAGQVAKHAPELAAKVVAGEMKLNAAYRQVQHEQKQTAPPLPSNRYRVWYADPPWEYGNSGAIGDSDNYGRAERHYPTMSIDELCAMGPEIKTRCEDDAVLFLWVTSPLLEECFAVIRAWGFKYKTSFVWDKVGHNFGHYNSVRHELLLVCTRGSCTPDNRQLYDSVVTVEKSRCHSEKPQEFREMIDSLYPRGRRIELFARGTNDGWDTWGNEAGKLPAG